VTDDEHLVRLLGELVENPILGVIRELPGIHALRLWRVLIFLLLFLFIGPGGAALARDCRGGGERRGRGNKLTTIQLFQHLHFSWSLSGPGFGDRRSKFTEIRKLCRTLLIE
jgi:hypothetical protein